MVICLLLLAFYSMGQQLPLNWTIDEVNLALCETIRQRAGRDLPTLLVHYKRSALFEKYARSDFKKALTEGFSEHNIPQEFDTVLWEAIAKIGKAPV